MKTKRFFYNFLKEIVNIKNIKLAFVTLSFLLSMLFNKTFAQMSINTTGAEANPSAGLDIDFSNKGLLIPRVALSSKTDATTIPNPATGLMVYNTGTGSLSLAGYYYNAGTSSSPNWVHLSTTGLDGSGEATRIAFWSGANTLSSNANLYWDNTNSRLGVGTSSPGDKLEINGNVLATAFKGTGNYRSVWGGWGNSIWLERVGHNAIFYNDPVSLKGFMIGFHSLNDKIYIGHTTDGWSTGSYLGMIDGEGRVGIKTDTNSSYRLYVNGDGSTTAVRGVYNSSKFGDLGTAYHGVYGQASTSIYGYLGGSNGAYGQYNDKRYGVLGHPSYGVFGRYNDNIYGYIGGGTYAGYFYGNVRVTGSVTKGSGSFLIDHPLEPLNKTLRHNFVESTWNMCIYPGKVKLDESGVAKVIMPDYYTALVKEDEAIAQITPVGKPFSVGCEWNDDFTILIIYGEPNREVYYTVMADRDDPVIHLLAKPIEEEKGNGNFTKGKLLYPKAYGYPEEMGEDYDEKFGK